MRIGRTKVGEIWRLKVPQRCKTLIWLAARGVDEIQQEDNSTSNDPLKIPSGPITRARSKSIKEALNGLVQEAWTKQMAIGSTIEDKDAENVTNVIWAEQGVV